MSPGAYLQAARVPHSLAPQSFGLWRIARREINAETDALLQKCGMDIGAPDYTLLYRYTMATLHADGEIVMEDSARELRRHLPIWLAARGRVLVTGLGLGCVVRGLLASPHVSHIDIVEIDADIIRVVGPEFVDEPRCTIHHADATKWKPHKRTRWDFAWHDLWSEDKSLQILHGALLRRFHKYVEIRCQGAWMFPRTIGRRIGTLGAPR